MIRYVLCFLLFGGAVMAKDGGILAPPKHAADEEEWQQFLNSEEGQDIVRIFEEFSSGKKTFDQTADEYQQKWGGKAAPPTVSTAPNAPYLPVK